MNARAGRPCDEVGKMTPYRKFLKSIDSYPDCYYCSNGKLHVSHTEGSWQRAQYEYKYGDGKV